MGDFDPLKPSVYGKHPHKDTPNGPVADGPFGFVGTERDNNNVVQGFSTGAGLYSGRSPDGTVRGDVLEAQLHFGGWRDEVGKSTKGVEGDASLARFSMPLGGPLGPFGFEAGVLNANAAVKQTDETTTIGAQANLLEGAVQLGNQEEYLRVGGSLGVGAGARFHYGDADGDGAREYGFGFDAGPLSFDFKNELLGRGANAVGDAWSSITSW